MYLHLKKTPESLSPNDALLKIWFKLTKLFREKKSQCIFTIWLLFLLGKVCGHHLIELEFITYNQGCYVKRMAKSGPVVLEKTIF